MLPGKSSFQLLQALAWRWLRLSYSVSTLSLSDIPHIVDPVSIETALDGEARRVLVLFVCITSADNHLCCPLIRLKDKSPRSASKSTVLWMYAHRTGPAERIGTMCGPYT